MTLPARFALGFVFLLSMLSLADAQAPTRQANPSERTPFTFGKSTRADNPNALPPNYALRAPGLYSRPIVSATASAGDYAVQVLALLISPHTDTADTQFPGAAVLMLRAGSVLVVSGDSRIQLESGSTTLIPDGASVRFINSDAERPAHLRAAVITGSR